MKKYFLSAILILALALSTSCTKGAEPYEFPINRETVEHVKWLAVRKAAMVQTP